MAIGRLDDSTWVVEKGVGFRIVEVEPQVGEFQSDSITLGLVRATANSKTVIWLPAITRSWSIGVAMKGEAMAVLPAPYAFKGGALYGVADNRLWMVDASSGVFQIYDSGAKSVQIGSVQIARRPFDKSAVATLRETAIRDAKNAFGVSIAEGRHDPKFLPDSMPLFMSLIPGPNGEVWLQEYEVLIGEQSRFVVVSSDGKVVASVILPPNHRLEQIGMDYVLAVRVDEHGAESVVEYPLKR